LYGYEPILLPHATLKALKFSDVVIERIRRAGVFVFPSPFAIAAAFRGMMQIRSTHGLPMPVLAVIGQGSLQVLLQEIVAIGMTPEHFRIVANHVEPFDALHLVPLLRQVIADSLVPVREQVLIMTGDKTNNDAHTWDDWLNDSDRAVLASVEQAQVYESIDTFDYQRLVTESLTLDWCRPTSAVYFTSSSSVKGFAQAAKPSLVAIRCSPTAITIHSKISKEVQGHLGWNVVEIAPGAPALLHWLSHTPLTL
jgi:uroporphyrinogen-III synthase